MDSLYLHIDDRVRIDYDSAVLSEEVRSTEL